MQKGKTMADLIERQAVMDTVAKSALDLNDPDENWIMQDRIKEIPSAQAEQHYDEWCTDCKEYDTDKHCCPRWNRVIRQTLKDAQPEPQWIPCSERLPSEGENVLLCDTLFDNVTIGKLIKYNTSCCWEVDHWDFDIEDWQAWMPLPEPYKGEQE